MTGGWRERGELPLWLLPGTGVILALLLGSALSAIEIPRGSPLDAITFRGGVDEARQMLAVISGTMITVTGLVFVLTVVALQLASTQFSPRLLRSFLADLGTQVVLATFVMTFAYSIAGLHTVGGIDAAGDVFVPRLAISGAMLLALISVGMLVFYIQHVTDSIRIDTIMQHSERDTLAAIDRQHPPAIDRQHPPRPPPVAEPGPSSPEESAELTVPASRSGYLQGLDARRLLEIAVAHDLVIVITLMRGQHVLDGSPAGYVVPDRPDVDTLPAARRGVTAAIAVAPERIVHRDAGFGIRQLVDITTRAMATGSNDFYTAVQAVHHLTTVLSVLPGRMLGWQVHRDAQGRPRVYVPTPTFEEYLSLVCSEIRPHATRSLRLVAELLHLLARMATVVTTREDREIVARQIELVVADARRAHEEEDLGWVLARATAAREAVAGRPTARWPE